MGPFTAQPVIKVFATGQFEALHCWPDAPEPLTYLRAKHRHLFHWKATVRVAHANREVEFITLKRAIGQWLTITFKPTEAIADLGTLSCEQLAQLLIRQFNLDLCEVSEDGENGAEVYA